jgi:tetratricopeptide (TPR) repeat protein
LFSISCRLFSRITRVGGSRLGLILFKILIALAAAMLLCANARSAPPRDEAAAVRSAREKFDAGDYASAAAGLKGALASSPDDPEVRFWLGRCAYELFDFNAAAADLERAVQLRPQSSLYRLWLGRSYSEKADRDHSLSLAKKTKKEFEEAVKLDPSNVRARRDLAEYEMDAPWIAGGSKDDARKQAEAIAALDRVEGQLTRAMIAFRVDKNAARAEEIYHQILKSKPRSIQPYFESARFFQHYGKPGDLEAALRGAAEIDASDARLDYFRGVAKFLEGGDLPSAEQLLNKYVTTAPQRSDWPYHADAREWLGRVLEAEGKRAEAMAQYRESLRLEAGRKIAREHLAKLEKSSN